MCEIWWVEEFREGDGFLKECVLDVRHCCMVIKTIRATGGEGRKEGGERSAGR